MNNVRLEEPLGITFNMSSDCNAISNPVLKMYLIGENDCPKQVHYLR